MITCFKLDIIPGIAICGISDHLPPFMILKNAKPKQVFKGSKVRNMKFSQEENLIAVLKEQILFILDFDNHTSISSQIIWFYQTFNAVLEVHAPLCTASRKQKKI